VATERKQVLLRLDPDVHDALARWAGDELRSTNAQIEFLLRRALADASRLPSRSGHRGGPDAPQTGTDVTSHAKFPGKTLAQGTPPGLAAHRDDAAST
jgi:hypothetical protein